MKVLERSVMPNGIKIQLEDWKEVYPNSTKTISIGAYPIAKNESYFVKRNENFRLTLSRNFSSDDEVRIIFESLIGGFLTLEELSDHYRDGDKDRYYMGLITNRKGIRC